MPMFFDKQRPNLKQFMIDLICTNDGGLPLWMRIRSGNESDFLY